MSKTQTFIEKAKQIHGELYNYDHVSYVNSTTPVDIVCPAHGLFQMRPSAHLSYSRKCPKCSSKYQPTTAEFVQRAAAIHDNKYDYSKVVYVDSKTPITVICPTHGEFSQIPAAHINNKSGCKTCANENSSGQYHKHDTAWFVQTATEIHGDKYDYSKVDYKSYHKHVEIVCPEHGSFFQTAGSHIHQRANCPTCSVKDYEGGYGEKRFQNHPVLREAEGILYVIKCTHYNGESFIKVGITQHDLEYRFEKCNKLPYAYEVIHTQRGNLYQLFKLEQRTLRKLKAHKYRPLMKFKGYTECVSLDILDIITEGSIFS